MVFFPSFVENKSLMGESNTLLYVIATIVILHIVAGIGFLIYKIGTAPAVDRSQEEEEDEME
jgi:hypothetical protein